MKQIHILAIIIMLICTTIYADINGLKPGFSLLSGAGSIFGAAGINAQYQFLINKSKFTISPFFGFGTTFASDNKWIAYSIGSFLEYGRKHKPQVGVYFWGNQRDAYYLCFVAGYHYIANCGFCFISNVGIGYGSNQPKKNKLVPAINIGLGYKFHN